MPDRGTTRGKRDLALLEVLARAGLRRAEAAAVRWEQLLRVERWPDGETRRAVAARPAEETNWRSASSTPSAAARAPSRSPPPS
jgi:hypothetical protein